MHNAARCFGTSPDTLATLLMARPATKWDHKYVAQAYRLAMLGLTDKQIATAFDVSERQFNNWKKTYPELLQSLNNGKLPADGNVTLSLYQRAVGFTHDEEIVRVLRNGTVVRVKVKKRYPPDTVACIFWLKNRQRELWFDTTPRRAAETEDAQSIASDVADALRAMRDIDGLNVALSDDAETLRELTQTDSAHDSEA